MSFLTTVGKKRHKVWVIYAYDREGGEIVAHVWGKRNLKTARKLRERLLRITSSLLDTSTFCVEEFHYKLKLFY